MRTLERTLAEYDLELLRVIAARWDVDLGRREVKSAAEQLAAAMLQPAKVEELWQRLDDDQRGALQTLLASGGRTLSMVFTRMFGEIREMGPGKLEREKPYLTPISVAEVLFYRGLIALNFAEGNRGNQPFVYIPTDLALLLPARQTSYSAAASATFTPSASAPVETVPPPDNVRLADTSIVDDLTTLLAFAQLSDATLLNDVLDPEQVKTLKPYLIGSASPARLGLLVALALELGLLNIQQGVLHAVGSAMLPWLEATRHEQIKTLAEGWRMSTRYNELWHTPGLRPEATGWQNDPLLARQAVLNYLEMVPEEGWWSVDALVAAIKEDEPDFQRPNGDYDSWYIRDAQTNQYLRGFTSWDKVDGAMLRFILIGPMHGLALLDLAKNGALCRLTAYGRAFIGSGDWPTTTPEPAPIIVKEDGLCEVPRAASRFERFQLSRFTEWIKGGDPYHYRISVDGLNNAAAHNIKNEQIVAFLQQVTDNKVPPSVVILIERHGQAGTQPAVIASMIVLRLPSEELLNTVQNNPAIRRYLGVVLGPTSIAVRPDQYQALASALQANGIQVQVEV